MKTNLLKSIFISLILLVGATNAWADIAFSGGYIYFDNSIGINQTYIQLCARQNSWTGVSTLSKINNTKLYYVANPQGSGWGGILGWVVIGNSSQKSNSNFDNWTAYGWCSNWNTYGFNSGSTYLIVPSSTSKSQSVTTSHHSGGYSALNSTQTIKTAVNGADANSKATITVTSYKLTGNGAISAQQSASISTSAKSTTIPAARTATTTLTVGDVATGYQFDGWYTAATGGTQLSTSTTYTYYPTAATTVYARFSAKKYNITYKDQGNVTFSGTHASGYPTTHTYGTATTLKNPTKNNYTFGGWFTSSNCSGSAISSLSATDYTADITLYAKWTINTHTVSYGVCSSTRWGSIKLNSETAITTTGTKTLNYGTAISFTATPNTGYQVVGWYSNADCTTQLQAGGNSYNAGTLTAKKTVYVKFEQIPATSHNITYTPQKTGWTYDANNPTSAEEREKVSFTVTPATGYSVTVKSDVDLEKNGNIYTFEMPSKDVEIDVTATEILSTITIYATPEEAGSVLVNGQPFTAGGTVKVGIATSVEVTAVPNDGYGVAAWSRTEGVVNHLSGSNPITITTYGTGADGVLRANFIGLEYTITFNKQEGTEGTDKATVRYKNNNYSVSRVETPTRAGYTFGGYYTQAAGAGEQVVSAEGQWLAKATGYTDADKKWVRIGDATLYAKWVELPPTTIYIRSNGSIVDFKWNNNGMTPMDCGGTYYTANIPASVNEITLTGSNNFTTTTLTVPKDDKVLYDLTSTNITHLYLKPNSNWTQASARFAAYFFGNGEKWVSMTDEDSDGVYEVEIPTEKTYPSVIFCRMNPNTQTNGWDNEGDNMWNQTSDLTIPTDGTNCYAVKDNTWDKGGGSWSTIYDNSKWTTFEAPTLNVQVNIIGKGSIVIDGVTYTSNTTGKETFAFTKPSGEDIAVGAITAADRWAYNTAAQITMCGNTEDLAASHFINGPATINLSFTQTSCEVVFNLNVPRGVEIPSWSIANQYVAMNSTATEPTSVGEIGDYLFGGWYTNGSTFTDANKYDFSTPVTGDLDLYARWIPYAQCIFFKNNLKWNDVYVYTFENDAWDAYVGVKVKDRYIEYGKMTKIGQTDVYYYTLTNTTTGFSHIAFSETDMHNNNEFYGSKAIYRGDRSDQMPLFIPQTDQTASTTNSTKYYSSGIWMKYNSIESGYKWSSDKNGWSTDVNPFTASAAGGYAFTARVTLSGGTNYKFKTVGLNNSWFGYKGTLEQNSCTNKHFKSDVNDDAQIHPTVTGEYLFTIYLGDGKMMLSIDYPLGVGDYRLVYKDNTPNWHHPSHYIKKKDDGSLDTISFFIHHTKSPQVIVQRCTDVTNAGETKWEDLDLNINPAASITESGVYNFVLQQIKGQNDPILVAQAHPYTGNYYIRTDAAAGGWDSFRQESNLMTYNSYADVHEDFDHYFCHWVEKTNNEGEKNVQFTIANDYSYCISDTLKADPSGAGQVVTNEHGHLPNKQSANVRFGWDSKTNAINRAYIAGATNETQATFLHLVDAENLKNSEGTAVEDINFKDLQNWIYQVDVKATSATKIKLVAEYAGKIQYFKGAEGNEEGAKIHLLSSTAQSEYNIRLIYNFKCNHLVAAVVLEGDKEIMEDDVLGADLMVVRKDQGQANQITFNQDELTINTAYAVMTFTKDWVNDTKLTNQQRSDYWVSFPFDVKISDVFGFGEYGDQWIMLLYDGQERAEKGNWVDSPTFWKYITNRDYTLEAGVGYVLKLNLNKMTEAITYKNGATEVSLYFPSTPVDGHTIIDAEPTSITVPAHTCTIERDNRNIKDSHWNLIGVPGYANLENLKVGEIENSLMIENEAHNLTFYYEYDAVNNRYNTSLATATFKNMHAYMVQYAGELEWTNIPKAPASIAARRNSDAEPEKAIFRLELAQGEEKADQTFVQMQQEGATADFDMNVDMTKIINAGANIYTLVGEGQIEAAGNVLPMGECEVPVGVKVDAAGEYTFRMPDGTEGMVVELIDYYTNTRTNLLLFDYTVELTAGTSNDRFAIHIQPSKSGVATDIDQLTGSDLNANGVQKYIIDGCLYLKKDGILYDAHGHIVR